MPRPYYRYTLPQKRRKTLEWLRATFPLARPVTVRWRDPGDDCYGSCALISGRLYIDIHPDKPWHEQAETLFHEWAHGRTEHRHTLEMQRLHENGCHDDEFWLEYGRLYREWYEYGGRHDALGH